jgi:hypothetical protein
LRTRNSDSDIGTCHDNSSAFLNLCKTPVQQLPDRAKTAPVVGILGISGAIKGNRLLQVLNEFPVETTAS